LRYFRTQLDLHGVNVKLNCRVNAKDLKNGQFDHVILATGVTPRKPKIQGIEHPKAVSYVDVLRGQVQVGATAAIIGAGGIGFDVAEFLTDEKHSLSLDPVAFAKHWGIDLSVKARGGIDGVNRQILPPSRKVYLLQRTEGKLGAK